jgi:GNAT superfamily N-acetyltransferase
MIRPDAEPALAGELLARSEQYLRERGARQLFGGGTARLAPFYYGLYGGSEPSGILDSDRPSQALFEAHGYQPASRSLVLHRELAQFRPVVDRQQMQIRRHNTLQAVIDPPTSTWWDACLYEPLDRTEFVLVPRGATAPAARVYFWNMETMAPAWGVRAAGIVGLEVWGEQRRQGLATFLLGEAIRQMHAQGVALAEVQVAADNESAVALFQKLGFNEVDQAVHYRKP